MADPQPPTNTAGETRDHDGYGECCGIGRVWVDDGEASNFYEGGSCARCRSFQDKLSKRIAAAPSQEAVVSEGKAPDHALQASIAAVWAFHVSEGTATPDEERQLLDYLTGRREAQGASEGEGS